MNPTLIATLAGLTTAFCWGTGDWLSAKSTKKINPLEINFAVQTASLIMMGVLFLFSGVHIENSEQLLRIATSSILITSAYLIFVKALSSGIVGIVVPLGNIYPLFTIGLSIIFLSAHFSLVQLTAMIGIILGAALLAYEKNQRQIPIKELHKETILALMAAFIWGVAFFIISPVVKQVSWQTISIVGEVFAFSFALLLIIVRKPSRSLVAIKQSLQSGMALTVGVIGITGATALYLGSAHAGSIIIPTVLSAGGPLIASIWGAIIDKEKIGISKRAGAIIVVAGIIVLNLA